MKERRARSKYLIRFEEIRDTIYKKEKRGSIRYRQRTIYARHVPYEEKVLDENLAWWKRKKS